LIIFLTLRLTLSSLEMEFQNPLVIDASVAQNVRNEEVLLGVNEQKNILHKIRNGRLTGLVTSYVETAF